MKVFVGSSSESKDYARDVSQVLRELEVEPVTWDDLGVFTPGSTIIEVLERVGRECEAAVIVAGEDDQTVRRGSEGWSPRDNVLYELGYFAGRFGRTHSILVRAGSPKLPSDLGGVVFIQVDGKDQYDRNAVRDTLADHLKPWLVSLTPSVDLPKLARTITQQLERLRHLKDWGDFDELAADLLNRLAESLHSDKGINHDLVDSVANIALPSARGIYAIDVLGPSGWLSPTAFRYLAVQIREYIRRNVAADGWRLLVSDRLAGAIATGVAHMNGKSATLFDNNETPRWWESGQPKLEFCRVLLWTEDELASPIAESVIAIHEAFNVPLLFIKRPLAHDDREVDYIFFADGKRVVAGFYGVAADDYKTHAFVNGRIPGVVGDAAAHFWSLIEQEKPMFAVDARQQLMARRRR